MNTIYNLSLKNDKGDGFFQNFFPSKKGGELVRDGVFFFCGFTVTIFVICFFANCVTAQDVSNVATPCFSNGYDPDYESSLSSLISSLADSSPVSGREDDDDDDDDGDDDGYDDDGSHDIEQEGPQVNGAANIEPSQELQSAEEQLHSLQNG